MKAKMQFFIENLDVDDLETNNPKQILFFARIETLVVVFFCVETGYQHFLAIQNVF
jgi:hypothetical protein